MWNGEKIRVMGVDIEPPYRPENIKSSPDNKALNHIRKIVSNFRFWLIPLFHRIIFYDFFFFQVEKHYRDLEAAKSTASTTPSGLSVT